ncbi:MAG: exodeoxyribonuclease V subunit alpha [Leptospiraceae bacterium]|nr:MAG: exodeoxyribonuclease V subunit alpha [Leptospiraceae bacterium]
MITKLEISNLIKEPSYYYIYLINDIDQYLNIESKLKEEEIKIWNLLIYYLLWSIEKGNLCIDLKNSKQLEQFTQEILKEENEIQWEKTSKILNKIKKLSNFDKIFYLYPDYPESDNTYEFLYFKKHYEAQNLLKEKIKIIQTIQNQIVIDKNTKNIIESYLKKVNKLDETQKLAIILSILQKFLIISGGPGTGKTTIASHIIGLHIELGMPAFRIGIAAPTGRAASRLYESLKSNLNGIIDLNHLNLIEPKTLHRLLYFKPYKNEFYYGENNYLPYDLILVDESSMIDIHLIKQLFSAISFEETKLVLLGDHNQLPSVQEGNTLADLKPTKKVTLPEIENYLKEFKIKPPENFNPYFIELTKSYRSIQIIKELADKIKENDMGLIDQLNQNKVSYSKDIFNKDNPIFWIEETDKEKIKAIIKDYIEIKIIKSSNDLLKKITKQSKKEWRLDFQETNPLHKLYEIISNHKILTPLKVGPLGTESIHQYLIHSLYKNLNIDPVKEGMPIIITQNDYYNELYNGDIGIILKDNKKNYYACFKGKDQYLLYSFMSLNYYDYSYAITIHKSQGSEYEEVLLILPEIEENQAHSIINLYNRQILYTAITRAKRKIYLISSEETLKKTIENKIERISGIKLWE